MTRLLMTVDAVGGVWTYAVDLARALRPQGVDTVLAVLGPPPDAAQTAEAIAIADVVMTGAELDWLADTPAAVLDSAARVADLARQHAVDLVQVNSAPLALAEYPCPVVAWHHSCVATWWAAVRGGARPADFAWRTEQVAAGLAAADRVGAPSTAFAAAMRDTYRLAASPAVVPNGRPARPVSDASTIAAVFTAGRLWDDGKNIAALDAVAAALPCPVRAAGPLHGPNGTSITLAAVESLGRLDAAQVHAELAQRPIFASMARYEPFGLAVLEAAQAGCPLVLSDIPTFRELWADAALFVPLDDREALRVALTRLIGDAALCTTWGTRARDRSARYTAAAMAAGMAALYADLLRQPRVAA